MAIPEPLLKVAAVFFDVIFVLLFTYFIFVIGLRLYWKRKAKKMKGRPVPTKGEFMRLKKGKGVVYFHAPNCRPCAFVDPVIKKLSKEVKGVHFIKVNVAEKPEVAREFGILATPTVVITENGTVKEILMGPVTEGTLREKLK